MVMVKIFDHLTTIALKFWAWSWSKNRGRLNPLIASQCTSFPCDVCLCLETGCSNASEGFCNIIDAD